MKQYRWLLPELSEVAILMVKKASFFSLHEVVDERVWQCLEF